MHKYKIAVISLLYDHEDYEAADDLVAGYLTAILRKDGNDVKIIEVDKNDTDTGLNKILVYNPGTIIFTIPRTSNIPAIYTFCRFLKSKLKQIKIILSGWSHHSAPLNIPLVMNNCKEIDVIIRGEGETTISELITLLKQDAPLDCCKGITYRFGDSIKRNEERAPVVKLDELPFPARDTHADHKYDSMWISSARGCMGNCTFCSVPATRSKLVPRWRGRSPENVVAELKFLYEQYGVTSFNFLDPTFEDPGAKGKERIMKLANLILESGMEIPILHTCAQITGRTKTLIY